MNLIDKIFKCFGYIREDSIPAVSSDKEINQKNNSVVLPYEPALPTVPQKFALAYDNGTKEVLFEKISDSLCRTAKRLCEIYEIKKR